MSDRLRFLREQHGAALLKAFRDDPRNRPFAAWLIGPDGRPIDDEAAADALLGRYRTADPSPRAVHLQWLMRQAIQGALPAEDLTKARETLVAFMAYKPRLTAEQRDLGRHNSLGDVWAAVEPFVRENAPTSGKDEDRREREAARAESTIVLDEGGWTIAIPKTERAACWWGRGTRWCTAADDDNMFDHYANDGAMVVFVRPDGAKFQFHAASRQFMDAADRSVELDVLSEIRPNLQTRLPGLACALEAALGAGPDSRWKNLVGIVAKLAWTSKARLAAADAWRSAVGDFGVPLSWVPDLFWNADIQMAAVTACGANLRHIPPEDRTYDLCLAAVTQRGNMLPYVRHSMIDAEIAKRAVESDPTAFRHVPKLMRDHEMALSAVSRCAEMFEHVFVLDRDREICLAAVRQKGFLLHDVPEEWRDEEMCRVAVDSSGFAFSSVPAALKTSDLARLAVLRGNGLALKHVDLSERRDLCWTAVSSEGEALRYVPDEYRDAAICAEAVRNRASVLQHVPPALRTYDLCLEAVRRCGPMLQYAPESLRDHALYLAAVKSEGRMLDLVPDELRDREIITAACLSSITVFERICGKEDTPFVRELVLDIVEHHSGVVDEIPHLMADPSFVRAALDRNWRVLGEVPTNVLDMDMCLQVLRHRYERKAAVAGLHTVFSMIPDDLRADVLGRFQSDLEAEGVRPGSPTMCELASIANDLEIAPRPR